MFKIDTTPLRSLYQAQPFKYSEFLKLSAGVFIIALICSLLIFTRSAFDEVAFSILSEQIAPVGIVTFCSIGITYFTSKIVFSGLISNYDNLVTKWFIWISKFGLGLLFSYVAIMLASIISIFISGIEVPEPYSMKLLGEVTIFGMIFVHGVYIFFFSLMTNSNHLPNFKKSYVELGFRVLVGGFGILFLIFQSLIIIIVVD